MRMFVITTLVMMMGNLAIADSRNDAISTIITLRNSGVGRTAPEEIQSVDSSFLTAEQYYQNQEIDLAERFYLLTIQKAQVLLSSLAKEPASSNQSTTPIASKAVQEPIPESTALVEPMAPAQKLIQMETLSSDEQLVPLSEKLVGHTSTYIVKKNETLRLIAAKLGVSRQHLAQSNQLDSNSLLKIGQRLRYNNLKIIPQRMTNGIVINIPDRTLYYFRQGRLATSIPVALGTNIKRERFDWKTPTGKFKIVAKQKDPTWVVPLSIRSEMEEEGKEVLTTMPPGPKNPLGKYAIKISIPGILIHSTTKPGSIYSFASHGCIRVNPDHMEEIFKDIKINTPGEIIYKPIKLAVTKQGRIFMEVHQDVYSKYKDLDKEAKLLIQKHKLTNLVNWGKVKALINLKSGIAEDVSL